MNNVDLSFGLASAGPSRSRALAAAIILLGSSPACRESLTQVDSGVVASPLRPALKIADPLPDLAELVAGLPPGRETPLVAMWTESWSLGVAAGRPLREEVYRAAGSLVLEIDSAAAGSAARAVRRALAEARSFDHPLSPHLSRALDEAEQFLDEAEEAGSGAYWNRSAVKALMAADALREISPRTVALSLVEAAEAVLGPAPLPDRDEGEPANRARARRLAWWGRLAVKAGAHELAMQRGYYACLLLGVEVP